jgi:phage-related protein
MEEPHEHQKERYMDITFYRSARGGSPVEDYLDGVATTEARRLLAALRDLEEHGIDGSTVEHRHIRKKVWELKIGMHRIFYAMSGKTLVALHATKKQGQKARVDDIDLAEKRAKEVLGT